MKKIILAILAMAGILTARGETIQITPGGLNAALEGRSDTIATLVVSGEGDARDLAFMAGMPALKSIDMSGLKIVELKSRDAVILNRRHFEADALPPYVFTLAKMETVKLPETLKRIGEGAFASSQLKELTMGTALERIDDWAFYNTRLATVKLPSGITLFGEGVFANCAMLDKADLGSAKLATLPAKTFRGCTALHTVTFPQGTTALGAESFLGSGMTAFNVPEQVNSIGEYALSSMPALKEYNASGNPQLGAGALFCNNALTKISGQYDFPSLSLAVTPSLAIDSSECIVIRNLGDYAFAGNGTRNLFFNNNLQKVGTHVLDGMTNLQSVCVFQADGNVPETATGAFDGVANIDKTKLFVKRGCENAWINHQEWGRFMVVPQDVDAVAEIENGNGIVCSLQENTLTVSADETLASVAVYSANGSLLIASSPRSESVTLDVSGVENGVIIVRASTTTGTATFKLRK